jgi:hypothetical protein
MSGILTINIAAPGTAEIGPNGGVTQSLPGHVWYTVTDSNGNSYRFGFDPISQGSPFGAGQVVNNDSTVYQSRYFSQSAPLTDAQVQALITYGQSTQNQAYTAATGYVEPTDPSISGFNTTYNVLGGSFGVQGLLGNNCISYVNGALSFAGVNSGQLMTALALPEWNAGSSANILDAIETQNGGATVTTTESCGNNDDYSCTITGRYSALNSEGSRTLLSDSWVGSDGSKGTDTYSSPNNFTSTVVNSDSSSSFVSDVNGLVTSNTYDSIGMLSSSSKYDHTGVQTDYEVFDSGQETSDDQLVNGYLADVINYTNGVESGEDFYTLPAI